MDHILKECPMGLTTPTKTLRKLTALSSNGYGSITIRYNNPRKCLSLSNIL